MCRNGGERGRARCLSERSHCCRRRRGGRIPAKHVQLIEKLPNIARVANRHRLIRRVADRNRGLPVAVQIGGRDPGNHDSLNVRVVIGIVAGTDRLRRVVVENARSLIGEHCTRSRRRRRVCHRIGKRRCARHRDREVPVVIRLIRPANIHAVGGRVPVRSRRRNRGRVDRPRDRSNRKTKCQGKRPHD